MDTDDKTVRDAGWFARSWTHSRRFCPTSTRKCTTQTSPSCVYKLQKKIVRRWLLEDDKRVDGRGMDEDPSAGC